MKKHNLRFRQIHLDFHTSPAIAGIGQQFNKEEFQKTLKEGHVNSVSTFATCHHGWSYYNTEVGEMHPNLEFDLLRAQFDACKEIDINVPIYLTAGVNNWASDNHPEWREIGVDGTYLGWTQGITDAGFHSMCFNTPYLDLLCEQISEVVKLFPNCDGIFLDIISQDPCCCKWCMESMAEAGLDPEKEEDRIENAHRVLLKYHKATTAAAKKYDSDMPIFHNSGHVTQGQTKLYDDYYSHLELESLPTGGWGYDHFPISAKYCMNMDHDVLGMTGKFHTTWGEFGGYKHPNALRYECAAMIAMGTKCSVGDQLHPSGKLDESTYKLIGAAYKEVEEKEPWCDNVETVADIAILSNASLSKSGKNDFAGDTGAGRILLEEQHLFDMIDQDMDFSKYKALLLPDSIEVNDSLKGKIDSYLSNNGKLILTGTSGLNSDKSDFLWDIGAEFGGVSEFQPDYALPLKELQPEFCSSPVVMYKASQRIKVTTGESLGQVYDPYFNRSYKHFCSHQHTPYKTEESGYDCGVINGNIMYLAHDIFSIYAGIGAVVYKDYVGKAIRKFMGADLEFSSNLPSTAQISLMKQPEEDRYILHLLYANKISRGGDIAMSGGNLSTDASGIEIIEDIYPLYDTEFSVKLDKDVKKVTLEPQGQEIPFEKDGDTYSVKVDKFECHQMVVFE